MYVVNDNIVIKKSVKTGDILWTKKFKTKKEAFDFIESEERKAFYNLITITEPLKDKK